MSGSTASSTLRVALALCLLLVACGEPRAPSSSPSPSPSSSSRPIEAAPLPRLPGEIHVAFGETVDLGWISLRLRALERCGSEDAAIVDLVLRTQPLFSQSRWPMLVTDEGGANLGEATKFGGMDLPVGKLRPLK